MTLFQEMPRTSVRMLLACCVAWLGLFSYEVSADELIADYGQLPLARDVTISPDGKHFAFIRRSEGEDLFLVYNIAEQKIVGGANASKLKARNVYFATNNVVILVVSETRSSMNIRGKWEQDFAAAYQIDTGQIKTLLGKHDELYPAQSGLSRIVGVNYETNEAYMPVFLGDSEPRYSLLKVNLETGFGRQIEKGKTTTRDWFIAEDGTVLAREDFSVRKEEYRIWSYVTGKPELIYEESTDIPSFMISGVTPDRQHLVYVKTNEVGDAVYPMSLATGEVGEPMFQQSGRDIDSVLLNGLNREFIGVRVSGSLPTYEYLDERLTELVKINQQTFGESSVVPISSTRDYGQSIFLVSGNNGAEDFFIYQRDSNAVTRIGQSYPSIGEEELGVVTAISYQARDGQSIPAIVTWPVGADLEEVTRFPLLVFPHGGPERYDSVRFNWWAQFFARKGYLILQPNFRGSTGYGIDFRDAGRGEWGRLMQDDITDGVKQLIAEGVADPERICIMGASYGGYAALAGGAFSPDLYRCVVSVAGVSDLPRMLNDEKRLSGKQSWAITYWERLIGDSKEDRELLKSISPSYAAENFKAPVLLVHGRDDTVVLISQSKRMHAALRKAKKPVEFVRLKGEDHWLSTTETRMATLSAISKFVEKHNPVVPQLDNR